MAQLFFQQLHALSTEGPDSELKVGLGVVLLTYEHLDWDIL